ncbi:hypothetical protein BJV77DRAFT_137327 [Russula vinacea]|nr:hypothetical protein BJV77DRAFT_137327 [Russula vinacea]
MSVFVTRNWALSPRAGPRIWQATSMAPKEPTKHQLSARLAYSQNTPAFLRKLQSRVSGIPDEDSDENPEFEDDGSGRPPIPRRPPIPERPSSDPGSGDEDRDDEAPQVVVLKEGKHLSAREVENEKRKAKGLPPLPDPSASASGDAKESKAKKPDAKEKISLSFSSSASSGSPSKSRPMMAKRKAVGSGRGEDGGEGSGGDPASKVKKVKKKPRVGLSFADDA